MVQNYGIIMYFYNNFFYCFNWQKFFKGFQLKLCRLYYRPSFCIFWFNFHVVRIYQFLQSPYFFWNYNNQLAGKGPKMINMDEGSILIYFHANSQTINSTRKLAWCYHFFDIRRVNEFVFRSSCLLVKSNCQVWHSLLQMALIQQSLSARFIGIPIGIRFHS